MRSGAILLLAPSLAERRHAHGALDAAEQHLLEVLRAGERGPRLPVAGVVAERGQPRLAAVVVLAPGDGVEGAHTGITVVALLPLRERAVVNRGEEPHALRRGYQVVPLVLAGPRLGQPLGRGVDRVENVDRAGLLGGVVLQLGAAEQATDPVSVVVGAEGVVHPDERAAALDVDAQRGLPGVVEDVARRE